MEECFEKFRYLLEPVFWKELLSNEFNRGYMAALLLILAVVIALLVIRFLLFLVFRTRRANAVEMRSGTGTTSISRAALENLSRQVFAAYPALDISNIRLYRCGGNYFLRLSCALDGSFGEGLPKILESLRPALQKLYEETFGINVIRRINIELTGYTPADSLSKPSGNDTAPADDDLQKLADETDSGI